MELINVGFIHEVLTRLGESYPDSVGLAELQGRWENRVLRVNLRYMEQHGLIVRRVEATNGLDDEGTTFIEMTQGGVDFVLKDGGLSALLNVKTVRLHQDTVRALLVRAVETSEDDGGVKEKLLEQLKSLPAQAIETTANTVLEAMLHRMGPLAIQLLRTVLVS